MIMKYLVLVKNNTARLIQLQLNLHPNMLVLLQVCTQISFFSSLLRRLSFRFFFVCLSVNRVIPLNSYERILLKFLGWLETKLARFFFIRY